MKKYSDKENQYKKIRHTVTVLGNILTVAIVISVMYVVFAIGVFHTSYLYLAIGLPIVLCWIAVLILLLCISTKKERMIKSVIYTTNKLTTTNPIFQEVIEEYHYDNLESLEHILPKKWKVVDSDDYNNTIVITIKKRRGLNVEVEISETDISITGETAESEKEISIKKSLTSDNFPDLSSVLVYIADICDKIIEG